MENKALVTIVTVTYNLIQAGRRETFLQTVQSVKKQTYPHIQHLIIDGSSNDGTIELLQELDLEYISEPDKGIYDAMNKGIAYAKGRYIALLNSDDFYHDSRMLEKCLDSLEKENLDFVCSNMYHLDEENPVNNYTLYADFSNIFTLMPFGHPTLFCKTEILRKYPFDLQYKIAADYDFVFKLFLSAYKGVALPYTFTTFRIGGACSHDTAKEAKGIRKKYLPYKEKILEYASSQEGKNQAKLSIITLYKSSLAKDEEIKLLKNKQSVQKQDYTEIELIRLQYTEGEFLISLKKALKKSTGDYILLLPLNATLYENSTITAIMQRFSIEKIQAIYSDIHCDSQENNSLSWKKLFRRKDFLENSIPYQAFIYRRDLLEFVDFTKTDFDDYSFHLELILQQGFAYGYTQKPLAIIQGNEELLVEQGHCTKSYKYLDEKSPYDQVKWIKRVKLFKKLTLVRIVETMWIKKCYLFGLIPLPTRKK